MGEGQFRLPDELGERLNELDNCAQAAVEAEDEPALDRLLDEMWRLVQGEGERLPEDE
jgi:predicted DNA-binding protein